jgi:hypothetical protein
MDLTLTGDIAKQIITLTRKDSKLALALARQFLSTVEPLAMARYLLTHEVATGLLAERITKNPEATLRQLQGLSAPAKQRGGRPTKHRGRRKRHRLTNDEIQHIKSDVRTYLVRHPWSNRKQIGVAVSFPSLAAYNRIMTEMRRDGIIQAQGEKSKTVYAVKGHNAGSAGGKRAKKPAKAASD